MINTKILYFCHHKLKIKNSLIKVCVRINQELLAETQYYAKIKNCGQFCIQKMFFSRWPQDHLYYLYFQICEYYIVYVSFKAAVWLFWFLNLNIYDVWICIKLDIFKIFAFWVKINSLLKYIKDILLPWIKCQKWKIYLNVWQNPIHFWSGEFKMNLFPENLFSS